MSTVETVAVAVLETLFRSVPTLLGVLKVRDDATSPLAEQVRRILPEEGESAKARKELERRGGG